MPESTQTEPRKSIWNNSLPPGESPPLPSWPLTMAVVAYSLWLLFLVAMMVLRIQETGG